MAPVALVSSIHEKTGGAYDHIPHLRFDNGVPRLLVDGTPFMILGGELQNSSLSCTHYMRQIWPKLKDMNINTVLGAVTWEQIEPNENVFDFATLDEVVVDARSHGMRLVLLWFGSFKNGVSTYTPAWVKTNPGRFPRAQLRNEDGSLAIADVLSVFDAENISADAKAFRELMRHIKDIDEHHSTVIMVQVQNEVGVLGDSRDRSEAAEKAFAGPPPGELLKKLNKNWSSLHPALKANLQQLKRGIEMDKKTSSWEDAFGPGLKTNELFMAYHYASYVESVAKAGKSEYPLPFFTNVWQNYGSADGDPNVSIVAGGGDAPGIYPSGGGVIEVLDIWQLFAPSLDFVAPDIYLNDYSITCGNYRHRNQPLFIPEQRRDEYGARRIWNAYGSHQALCTSPFGIDTLKPEDNPFTKHYELLSQVSKHVMRAQENPESMIGFFFDEFPETGDDPSCPKTAKFGQWNLAIERAFVFGKPSPAYGIVIHLGGARFLLIGEGYQIRFTSNDPRANLTGILSFVEKEVVNKDTGEMRSCRILNGDETRSGQAAIMPATNPDGGDFPICITIPARTRIAECEVYALFDEGN